VNARSAGSGLDLGPLLRLRLVTPRVELRLPTDDEVVELAHLAEHGVHPPEEMPFYVPWTDGIGRPGFVEDFVEFHRKQRAEWRPDAWNLVLGVWAGADAIGTQAVDAKGFAASRTAETGSWLGQRHQGRGFGTEMRSAVLELLFRGLGALTATSGAIEGNEASARVSGKLGYEPAGETEVAPRGVPVRERRFRLERAAWEAWERIPVELVGLEPCLPLFGL
jgi:RimJ/RimL family protein N-acetyltransferase